MAKRKSLKREKNKVAESVKELNIFVIATWTTLSVVILLIALYAVIHGAVINISWHSYN